MLNYRSGMLPETNDKVIIYRTRPNESWSLFRLILLVFITLLVSAIKIRLGNEPFSLGRGGDILFFISKSNDNLSLIPIHILNDN